MLQDGSQEHSSSLIDELEENRASKKQHNGCQHHKLDNVRTSLIDVKDP